MKISPRTSSLFAAILSWALFSALTVFIILGLRDRARLIRDNDNERLFSLLFTSLRNYDNFGSAIESTGLLRERIIGFGIYGEDLTPSYQWGSVPQVFDEDILKDYKAVKNGRYTIPDRRGNRIKFILSTEGMMSPPQQRRNQENNRDRDREENKNREDKTPGFFTTFARGKYIYIDISHTAYWRGQTLTAIAFPLCELALLALVFFVRGLYLRNREYRERIEGQKNLVVLGTAASTLAHEIKNPLLSIRLQTGILGKLFPEKGREELGIINEEVDRLSALSYRINDYLRDAAGQPVPLNISNVLSEASLRLCGRNIVEEDSAQDALVLMDTERARSVIENLIRNALESGSAENAIGAAILRHSGNSGDNELQKNSQHSIIVISIYDRGRGIAEGDLKRVFDPFFTSKSTGTGIGLSISKRFVEAAGGAISIENREGGGTAVFITLGEYV
ncbi:ATP-binding protein [Treponema primitia]|uniref:ATP-binding protein n=1 Tax=Treponema primitia TaxID=88058 RepID=UPI0002555723|nr:HAMP domain-containing sensor histidine kinase [Treponema primitia]